MLAVRNLTKRFPGVLAVDDVSFGLAAGEIMALLGRNGAGKSTVIGILSGLLPAGSYDGEMDLDGQPLRPASVAQAEAHGIVAISQEIQVVPDMTVAQNLFLNHEPARFGFVDRPRLEAQARELLDEFGVEVDSSSRMGTLDLARQQLVMIARALSRRARILILDEPTAALTSSEADALFARLRSYRAAGTACIFVSHRLGEVFAIADRIVVLRDGKVASDRLVAETTRGAVVEHMIGDVATRAAPARRDRPAGGQSRLGVSDLVVHEPVADRMVVDHVDLAVGAGEIVGLFGLVGSGAGVVVQAIFGGWDGPVAGVITIDGAEVSIPDPPAAIAAGMGYLSPDRRAALIGMLSITDNVVVARLRQFSRRGMLDLAAQRAEAVRQIGALGIATPSEQAAVRTLSGGNQQKVQVARWLTAQAEVLLLDDPTRGVDVEARAEIHRILRDLADDGRALLLVSSDADELLELCDRVLVMSAGRVVTELLASEASEVQLVTAATAGGDHDD